jgi:2-phospho-L-lactate guanylyltransferase
LVLTEDDEVEALALEAQAHVLRDRQGANLAQVVDAGLRRAEAAGAWAALVCMSDLPHVSAPELSQVLAALTGHAMVVAPDMAEAGTNVLALSPPSLLGTCFGHEDSFTRHLAQAAMRGLSLEVVRLPGLCFDVDGPEDLARL